MDEKWQTLRSDSLLKDRWIDLRADHCRTPAGQDVSPYYVLSYPEWVNIVAVTGDGRLVLVRQYRQAAGQSFLEIPGGAADPGDTDFEQAARRELLEETGYTAERFELVSSLYPNPATHTNRVHTNLAQNAMLTCDQSLDPGEEGLKVHLLPVADVLDGLRRGLLGQAMHVASVLLALDGAGLRNERLCVGIGADKR